MIRFRFAVVTAFTATLLACAEPIRFPGPTPETAALTWALLRSDSIPPDSGVRRRAPSRIFLRSTTMPDPTSAAYLLKAFPQLDSLTALAAEESLTVRRPLRTIPAALPAPTVLEVHDSLRYRVDPPETLLEIFRHRLFGSPAIAAVSAPAFSPDRGHAILAVSVHWGGLDGEGHYVLLQHRPEGWVVVASVLSWIS